jgi:H+-transporting ATPase
VAKDDPPPPAPKAEQPKPGAKPDQPKPEATSEPKPGTKTRSDLTPQVARRAYEIYEERAGNNGSAVQDWKKAEREIRSDEAKGEPKPEAAAKPEPEAKDKPQPDVSPQLVKRVHEVYEELGRKDVQSVQDWEKLHPEDEEHESHK